MPPVAPTRELPRSIGRYEVVRQIGVGAMGRVLLARDPVLERHVAIKLLRDDLAIGSDVRDGLFVRMRHEARAAARVTHPNLVVLHDMGEDDALGLYLVFEYLEGPTLKERLAERRLNARQAARLAKELGAALTYAHDKGVLHRDVKPENIILTMTGAKLADFGIARVPDSTLTHAGGLLGTPAYSAPETFRDGKFSPASDQFSLAATLYEALSGDRAFPGDDAVSVASRIANDPPKRFAEARGYPSELDEVLERGLAKSPTARFESCAKLGEALVHALVHEDRATAGRVSDPSTTLSRSSTLPTATESMPPAERPPWRVLLGGIVIVMVLALLLRSFLKNTDAALEEPQASGDTSADSAQPSTAAPPPRSGDFGARRPHLPSSSRPRGEDPRPASDSAHPEADAPSLAPSAAPATSAAPSAPAPAPAPSEAASTASPATP